MTTTTPGTPWTPVAEPVPIGSVDGTVMLVEGQAFVLSASSGDARPPRPHGLFVGDTRFLDRIELRVDGRRLEPLAVGQTEAFAATIVSRTTPAATQANSDVLVVRRRYLGLGLREDIEVRNYAAEPAALVVSLLVGSDFADVFAVKEGRPAAEGELRAAVQGDTLELGWRREGVERAVELSFHGDGVSVDTVGALWRLRLPPRGRATLCWDATVSFGGPHLSGHKGCGEQPERMDAVVRARRWDDEVPVLSTPDDRLDQAVRRSLDDLGALHLFDPNLQRRPIIAAGAPWFMTLFGRDSLITAWMALPLGTDLALGVLEVLASLQGTEVNAARDEEPGRILHELRFTRASTLSPVAGEPYFGSADATPLFVMLLAEACRWGAPLDEIRRLLPAADRALAWILQFGDRDGDGFVEYERGAPTGLANQGWKDSWDGVRFRDGVVAHAPIALCEVQGYVYAAFLGRAYLARVLGPAAEAAAWEERARQLRARFAEAFWMPDRGLPALALDGAKRQVDAATSNPGHCLWTGIVDSDHAPAVADALLDPAMWTGWGIRTMGSTDAGFNPMSYHCGSVWPHDNAIAVAGLCRYGFYEHAQRLVDGLLDVCETWDGALPELFCGLDRADVPVPVSYPTSCRPQAWAAGAPLLMLRSLLGFEPDVPSGETTLRGTPLPAAMTPLRWDGVALGGRRVDIVADARGCRLVELDPSTRPSG